MRKRPIAVFFLSMVVFAATAAVINAAGNYTYDADVKTILNQNNCISCHQYMGTYAAIMTEKSVYSPTNGLKIVYAVKPDSSVLIWRLEGKTAGGQTVVVMPLGGDKVSDTTIQKIKDWITQGAPEKTVGVEKSNTLWGDIKRMFR